MWVSLDEAKKALRHGTGRGVRVAVLDSGVMTAHPALAGMRLADDLAVTGEEDAWELTPGGGTDVFGHGTAVCGILHQIAPEAEIGSFRVLGEHLRSRSAIIRAGARAALERGYHVLNCSFGCGREDHVLLFKSWADEALVRGRHIVAAANNQNAARCEWPAHFASVIATGAGEMEHPEEFRADAGNLVEFTAHGVLVDVPWLGGVQKQVTGSSFAAPHLAGLLARLLSVFPGLPPLQAKALLRELATN